MDAQYKKDQVGEGVLQFPPLHRELANTLSAGRHGKHYGPLIKYLEVGDDKQLGYTTSKFCKDPRIEELACHGHQTDAPLS